MSTPASRSRVDLADRHAVHALHHDHARRCSSPRPSPAPAAGRGLHVAAQLAALAASRIRSSSSCRYLSNSATTSRGLQALAVGPQPLDPAAPASASARGRRRSTRSMPGRSTFTATSRPSVQRREVHLRDRGAGHRLGVEAARTLRRCGRPKRALDRADARDRPRTAARGPAACASSSAMSGGSRSRRVDSTCPNLTKIGPSCSSAEAQALAARRVEAAGRASSRATSSAHPALAKARQRELVQPEAQYREADEDEPGEVPHRRCGVIDPARAVAALRSPHAALFANHATPGDGAHRAPAGPNKRARSSCDVPAQVLRTASRCRSPAAASPSIDLGRLLPATPAQRQGGRSCTRRCVTSRSASAESSAIHFHQSGRRDAKGQHRR